MTPDTQPQLYNGKTWLQRIASLMFYISIITLFYLATSKQTTILPISNFDKVQHLVAFGWLTFLANIAWRQQFIIRFCIIFAISASIEIAQAFLSYRSSSGYDLIANAVGILLADFVLVVIRRSRHNRRQRLDHGDD